MGCGIGVELGTAIVTDGRGVGVGRLVGVGMGTCAGAALGATVDFAIGTSEGAHVKTFVVGTWDGELVGCEVVGPTEGESVGTADSDGDCVGNANALPSATQRLSLNGALAPLKCPAASS